MQPVSHLGREGKHDGHVDNILLLHQFVCSASVQSWYREKFLSYCFFTKTNTKDIFVLYEAGSLLLPLTRQTTITHVDFLKWSLIYSILQYLDKDGLPHLNIKTLSAAIKLCISEYCGDIFNVIFCCLDYFLLLY